MYENHNYKSHKKCYVIKRGLIKCYRSKGREGLILSRKITASLMWDTSKGVLKEHVRGEEKTGDRDRMNWARVFPYSESLFCMSWKCQDFFFFSFSFGRKIKAYQNRIHW